MLFCFACLALGAFIDADRMLWGGWETEYLEIPQTESGNPAARLQQPVLRQGSCFWTRR